MSFTDNQLLNLVNNTVLTKTDFDIKDFTGGGVQITSTHNHKIIKHKIYLTFGYDEKRNSRSYSEEIEEEITTVWQSAILLKVKSMQVSKIGSSLSDLNKLMNIDIKIEDRDIEIIDRDKECNDIVPTSLRTPPSPKKNTRFKVPRLEEIQNYILEKKYNVNAETFFNFYESNGWKVGKNKMKSWKASVATWNSKNKQQPQSFKEKDKQKTEDALDAFLDAREKGFDLRNVNSETVQDVEVLEG